MKREKRNGLILWGIIIAFYIWYAIYDFSGFCQGLGQIFLVCLYLTGLLITGLIIAAPFLTKLSIYWYVCSKFEERLKRLEK